MSADAKAGSLDVLVRSTDHPATLRELRWPRQNESSSDAAFREINRLIDLGWVRIKGVDRDGDDWVCLFVSPPNAV